VIPRVFSLFWTIIFDTNEKITERLGKDIVSCLNTLNPLPQNDTLNAIHAIHVALESCLQWFNNFWKNNFEFQPSGLFVLISNKFLLIFASVRASLFYF